MARSNQQQNERFAEPVTHHISTNFTLLRQEWTDQQANAELRQATLGDKNFYFYVADGEGRLAGVVPTRRLLTSAADQTIAELMIRRVVAIPQTATVFDACEFFVLHKFFALPVVDANRRLIGVVDISLVTEEVLEVSDPDEVENIFESLGFHMAALRNATPLKAFRHRFPWLLTTIASGTMAAVISGFFEKTLAELLILSFFLPLVLGLAESVAMQSMALTIQALRANRPTRRWYLAALQRESLTALYIGLACGATVALIVGLWRHQAAAAGTIGASVLLSLGAACLFGLSIPSLLHALKLDPKIAAGPVTLALTDIATLLFYFGGATLVLMP